VLRAKGIAEEFIRQSGLEYTILRAAVLFGEADVFFNILAALLQIQPLVFLMPGDGRTNLQPLWVGDLVTCIQWGLSDNVGLNQTLSLGGPEFVTVEQAAAILMEVLNLRRAIVHVPPVYLRGLTWLIEEILPRAPLTSHWLDYLAISRTCELTSVTRYFGLKPKRFSPPNLGYLRAKHWPGEITRMVFGA
jgi:NADH dehydrogenase